MRPGWLAWAAFYFGLLLPRIFADPHGSCELPYHGDATTLTLENSLFVLLYWMSTYAAEKIPFVSSFPKMLRDVHKPLKASIAIALQG